MKTIGAIGKFPAVQRLVNPRAFHAGKIAAEPVQKEIRKVVERVNKQLAPFEQIRKYRVLGRDFSIEDGELTATMKVRRARVMENFRESIEELYAGKEA